MSIHPQYIPDAEAILSHRYDNGADYWTTSDKRLLKGSPFSAYNSAQMLLELGMDRDDPILKNVADLFFSVWKTDGRFKVYPSGGIYPCHTIYAANLLSQMGYSADERLIKTFCHLLEIQHSDGGWRCSKFFFGHGPETESSNPNPTLLALNAFRYSEHFSHDPALKKAVSFLLWHWTSKLPAGPCHYGIGTLFMQTEYPFGNYNLFHYVYVLSFYDCAKNDPRFLEAFHCLEDKLVNGQIVVERVVPKLAKLTFCQKGHPSELATRHYNEILKNLEKS